MSKNLSPNFRLMRCACALTSCGLSSTRALAATDTPLVLPAASHGANLTRELLRMRLTLSLFAKVQQKRLESSLVIQTGVRIVRPSLPNDSMEMYGVLPRSLNWLMTLTGTVVPSSADLGLGRPTVRQRTFFQ